MGGGIRCRQESQVGGGSAADSSRPSDRAHLVPEEARLRSPPTYRWGN